MEKRKIDTRSPYEWWWDHLVDWQKDFFAKAGCVPASREWPIKKDNDK